MKLIIATLGYVFFLAISLASASLLITSPVSADGYNYNTCRTICPRGTYCYYGRCMPVTAWAGRGGDYDYDDVRPAVVAPAVVAPEPPHIDVPITPGINNPLNPNAFPYQAANPNLPPGGPGPVLATPQGPIVPANPNAPGFNAFAGSCGPCGPGFYCRNNMCVRSSGSAKELGLVTLGGMMALATGLLV